MEIHEEELIRNRLNGKLEILRKSKRILGELYLENIRKERKILINWENNLKDIKKWKESEKLIKERKKIFQEIQIIDDQLE